MAYDRLSTFEFGIATEVFALPRPEFGTDWYDFRVVSADGPSLQAIGGVRFSVDHDLAELSHADIIVLPGWRAPYVDVPSALQNALCIAHERGARIVAICGGAYVLAATGLLRGRQATTHWRFIEHFVGAYPDIDMATAPLFCEDSNLYTSAGSAAGIDLCLHVVQQDYGQDKANSVARRLVVPLLRPGAQPQTASQPVLPQGKHHQFTKVLETLKHDLAAGYTIAEAAALAGLTPRTFMRQFEKLTGANFGTWIAHQRTERAKTLLAETDLSIELVADACGYTSSSSLRRLFSEHTNMSPSAFRRKSNRVS